MKFKERKLGSYIWAVVFKDTSVSLVLLVSANEKVPPKGESFLMYIKKNLY